MNLNELNITDWYAPEMHYIKYDPKMKDYIYVILNIQKIWKMIIGNY